MSGGDWEAVDRAEQRLVARSAERRTALARRDRRRSWLPWLLAPLVFPAVGAVVLLLVLEREGGDLGGWSSAAATAFVATCFGVPALLAAFAARRAGRLEAAAWAAVSLCAELALVAGAGFLLLGLGPDQ